jgi:hypothetical protein
LVNIGVGLAEEEQKKQAGTESGLEAATVYCQAHVKFIRYALSAAPSNSPDVT